MLSGLILVSNDVRRQRFILIRYTSLLPLLKLGLSLRGPKRWLVSIFTPALIAAGRTSSATKLEASAGRVPFDLMASIRRRGKQLQCSGCWRVRRKRQNCRSRSSKLPNSQIPRNSNG